MLSVVYGESHVAQRVLSRAVDELLGPLPIDHVAVGSEDGPDLYCLEETQMKVSIHRANEHKSTVHILKSGHQAILNMELTGMAAIVHDRRVGGRPARPRA
jgi:hypothetical protein